MARSPRMASGVAAMVHSRTARCLAPLLLPTPSSRRLGRRGRRQHRGPKRSGHAGECRIKPNPLTEPYTTACVMEPDHRHRHLRQRHESAVADRVAGQDDAHADRREKICRRQPQARPIRSPPRAGGEDGWFASLSQGGRDLHARRHDEGGRGPFGQRRHLRGGRVRRRFGRRVRADDEPARPPLSG